ncbi:MAG: hypothetical protein NTZ05_06045 [Chloroflexi bacterium]|nr:hypothetical protein [Chloroflexota bacterium]
MRQRINKHDQVKVSVTVNPELLAVVDAYIADHPHADRSKVFDEALLLWCVRGQDGAREAQFTGPISEEKRTEREDWRHIRRAAAERRLKDR